MTQTEYPPLPLGADPDYPGNDDWQPAEDGRPPYRCVGSKPFDNYLEIRAVIVQFADGTIGTDDGDEPVVFIGHTDYHPDDAREIAAAIIRAADLADQWAQQSSPVRDTRLDTARGSLWLALEKLSQLERDKARHELNCMACRVETEDVRCPICQADPGQPCADTDGEPRIAPHASRASVAEGGK